MPPFTRILPLILIVFALAFSVRLSDVVTGVSGISSTAFAKAEEHSEKKEKMTGKEDGQGKHASMDDESVEVVDGKEAETPHWRDASDSDIDISGVKEEMFRDMMARRKKLDGMEKQLRAREALLQAAEKEVDRKVLELAKLKKEIEALLNKQTEEENARIGSLVKIYEGMKPKDAARIFDTLDIDVLVAVMSTMSERKVAPILAAMNAERARTVTIMLAEQNKLPELR